MPVARIAAFLFFVAASTSAGVAAPAYAEHTDTPQKALRQQGTTQSSELARAITAIVRWSPLGGGVVAVGYMLLLAHRPRREDNPALATRRV